MTSTLIHSTGNAGATATHANGGTSVISRSALSWSQDKEGLSRLDSKGLKQLWKLIALEATRSNRPTATIAPDSSTKHLATARKINTDQSNGDRLENDRNTVNVVHKCCPSKLSTDNRQEPNIFNEKVRFCINVGIMV